MEIKIDYDKCTGCRNCVDACNYSVLEFLDDVPVVAAPGKCASCLKCVKVCPVDAITVE